MSRVQIPSRNSAAARATVLNAASDHEKALITEAFDNLELKVTSGSRSAMALFCEAEAEVSREKGKAQQLWFNAKLETARIAADVREKHKAIEVAATCAKQFDEQLAEAASSGGSIVEQQLAKRVDEQQEELERLKLCEEQLVSDKALTSHDCLPLCLPTLF